jgi:hypothetical protein
MMSHLIYCADLQLQRVVSVLFIAPVTVYESHIPKMMLQILNGSVSRLALTDNEQYEITTKSFDGFINESRIGRENAWYPNTIFCPKSECVSE